MKQLQVSIKWIMWFRGLVATAAFDDLRQQTPHPILAMRCLGLPLHSGILRLRSPQLLSAFRSVNSAVKLL
jgi:hypothetical protein